MATLNQDYWYANPRPSTSVSSYRSMLGLLQDEYGNRYKKDVSSIVRSTICYIKKVIHVKTTKNYQNY